MAFKPTVSQAEDEELIDELENRNYFIIETPGLLDKDLYDRLKALISKFNYLEIDQVLKKLEQ